MIRAGDTGRRRQAIAVAVRAPDSDYETPPELRVEPGGEARLVVRVHNRSASPESLHLAVEGVPDGWADLHPDRFDLAAGDHREAQVTVHFPSTRTAEWTVRAVVFARGRRVASAPAHVHVTPHAVLALELEPGELRARRRVRADLRIANAGNAAADVELLARDDVGRLDLRVAPARVRVEAGGEAHARLEVNVPRRRWFGRPSPSPLLIEAQAPNSRATALGMFQQRPVLPRVAMVVPVLAAALGAWVASRPPQVAVPHVTGMSVSEAKSKLKQAGLIGKPAPMPAEDPRHPETGVVAQEPRPGEEVHDGDDVTISYEAPGKPATVTPKVATSSIAPPPGDSEPLAYVRANRIYVRFPGEPEQEIAGTVGELRGDPAWNPATSELAYVRRRSLTGEAEIVAVNPRAPGAERRLTTPGRSYTSPAFSPSGTLLALIADDGSGYGGELCIEMLPGDAPGCQVDKRWRYANPVFADDLTLYALRRRAKSTRDSGWEELVRVRTDTLAVEGEPVARGDLRSVAVAYDGSLAIVARRASDPSYHVEVLSAEGVPTAIETQASASCTVAWSGDSLLVSRGACGSGGQLVQVDPRYLDAPPTILGTGDEPSVAP